MSEHEILMYFRERKRVKIAEVKKLLNAYQYKKQIGKLLKEKKLTKDGVHICYGDYDLNSYLLTQFLRK